MVLCHWLCPLNITTKVSDTHTHTHCIHANTYLWGGYDYLSGRSPLATDLLIEQSFFLPFNQCWYQSCWRIQWSLLEMATIIKWQCDPQAEREWCMCGTRKRVLVCQSVNVSLVYAVCVTGDKGVDLIRSFCDPLDQVLTTIAKPWKRQMKRRALL